jgi:hypothetical protein
VLVCLRVFTPASSWQRRVAHRKVTLHTGSSIRRSTASVIDARTETDCVAVDAFTVEPVSGHQHPQELGKIMGKRMLPLEYKVHTGLPRP